MVVNSGIRKTPVSLLQNRACIEVKRLGLAGDEQVDLSVHGGLEKAVYMYPAEHYEWWRERRLEAGVVGADDPLPFAVVGENLTTSGLLETQLWVGDRILIDEVEFRVESPRNPCYKFNAVMGYTRAAKHMMASGYSGVYLSVSKTGFISAGSAIQVIPGRRQESISAILDRRRVRARREP
ncbi:MOSC domain-containing protein [Paraburkholderia dipogonis]|uniref:MOSC domain-containing protein n=1 Tax=Paraburkholderia dipogonis TaxID=1211383 RepID=UPI0038BCC29D